MKLLISTSWLFILLGIIFMLSDSIGLSPGMPMGGVSIKATMVTNIIGGCFIILGIIILYFEIKTKDNH